MSKIANCKYILKKKIKIITTHEGTFLRHKNYLEWEMTIGMLLKQV